MTREEAIKGLKVLRKDFSGYKPNEEMFDMAIAALKQLSLPKIIIRQGEQEPCDKRTDKRTETHECDCISREDAIEALDQDVMGGLNYRRILRLLPSADRPTGHWIEHDDERVLCECSECHEKYLLYEEHVLGRNFCPNCGCAMKGGEEE